MRAAATGWAAAVLCVAIAVTTVRGEDVPTAGDTHPTLPADAAWARPLLWSIGGLFAAAAAVGPVVWARARSTVPPAATHEEDPAADRH